MRPNSVLVCPVFARFGDLRVEIFFHAAVALEICGDKFGGFFCIDTEMLRETKRRKPINHAEIDHFCDAPVLAASARTAPRQTLPAPSASECLRRAGTPPPARHPPKDAPESAARSANNPPTAATSRSCHERSANLPAQLRCVPEYFAGLDLTSSAAPSPFPSDENRVCSRPVAG